MSTSLPRTTAVAASRRIGVVAGHWSADPAQYDPGAVCPAALGGTKEVDVNHEVASRVQQLLFQEGYEVDLLEQNDARIYGYRALAFVAIHTDSCDFINAEATGFKVAAGPTPESDRLAACLQDRYSRVTGLAVHPGVTTDMTNYYSFYDIHDHTPAAIIELGFLNLDYEKLTREQDKLARGVADGILCFVRNEAVLPTPTP